MDFFIRHVDGSTSFLHSSLTESELKERYYAFPEQRKYPLPDKAHVLSAIRFFNYVSPKDEKQLARAIIKRMKELNMAEANVGKANRFRKYYNTSQS